MRRRFSEILFRQDCNPYDDSEAGALTNLVVNYVNSVQAGIDDKVATATQFPFRKRVSRRDRGSPLVHRGPCAYGEAEANATETFSLISTITTFGSQEESRIDMKRVLKVRTNPPPRP